VCPLRPQDGLRAGACYQDRGLVFAGERGGIIDPSDLRNRSFVPLPRNADLPRSTFHDLRPTCASRGLTIFCLCPESGQDEFRAKFVALVGKSGFVVNPKAAD
jgi:integrase